MSRWAPEGWRSALRPRTLFLAPDAVWDVSAAPAVRHADFASWCAAHPQSRCRLFVSSHLLHSVDSAPGLPLHTRVAVAEHARALLIHYHGVAAETWPLAAWRNGGFSGACAMHRPELGSLKADARAHQVRLAGVHPWWSAAWHWALFRHPELGHSENARLLLVEGALVTRVRVQRGALCSVGVHRLAGRTAADLQELIAEGASSGDSGDSGDSGGSGDEALAVCGYGVENTAALESIAGDPDLQLLWPPAASMLPPRLRRAPRYPDLLGPPRASPLAWAAAGVAAMTLALAGTDAAQSWADLQRAQAVLEARAATHAAGPALPTDEDPLRAGLAPLRTALARPWPRIFAAVEASSLPGVQWLMMDQGGSELRLQAAAPDADTALKVASALAAQPDVRRATVSRVLADAGENGSSSGPGVRFELVAELAQPAAAAAAPRQAARAQPAL